jgi:uncharacterized membrane protein
MNRIQVSAVVGLFWCCGVAAAGELVVAPFAVPVAVPVAVVQQPTLFYGVSRYAPPQPVAAESTLVTASSDAAALRAQVDAILVRRCAECHRADAPHGDVALFDAAGKPLDKLPRQLLVEASAPTAIGSTAMPPAGRAKLTADEWSVLRQWARMPKSFAY